jgi:DNA-binding transcriptional ArsR family regulator
MTVGGWYLFLSPGLYPGSPCLYRKQPKYLLMAAKEKELSIDLLQLKKAASVLRSVNHQLRLEILRLLHREGRMPVTALRHKIHLEQTVASQQLAILRRAGMVATERSGKQIFYSVNYQRLREVQQQAAAVLHP